jgi:hypothetical protein
MSRGNRPGGAGGPGRGQQTEDDPTLGPAALFPNALFGYMDRATYSAGMEVVNGEQKA